MRSAIAFVSFFASAAAFAPSSLPQVRNDLSVRKAWDNDRRPLISPVDDLPANGYGQQRPDGTYQNNYQGNDYPTRVENNNYYRQNAPMVPPELPYDNRGGLAPEDTLAAFKSILAGAIVGVFVIAPFSALHHLVVVPSANGLIKWEWDVVMAAVQGAGFASAYQYLLRSGDRELRNAVIIASGMIRTVGVVPYTVGKWILLIVGVAIASGIRLTSPRFLFLFCRWQTLYSSGLEHAWISRNARY